MLVQRHGRAGRHLEQNGRAPFVVLVQDLHFYSVEVGSLPRHRRRGDEGRPKFRRIGGQRLVHGVLSRSVVAPPKAWLASLSVIRRSHQRCVFGVLTCGRHPRSIALPRARSQASEEGAVRGSGKHEDAMKFPRRQFLRLAASAVALPAVSRSAWAQTYPARPVRMIVSFPAGNASDIVARRRGAIPVGAARAAIHRREPAGRRRQYRHRSRRATPRRTATRS